MRIFVPIRYITTLSGLEMHFLIMTNLIFHWTEQVDWDTKKWADLRINKYSDSGQSSVSRLTFMVRKRPDTAT